jgi:hypothetical protein
MAQDFYPVIARAIAGLDENGAEARRVVYDHARTVLVRQLRELNTGLSIGLHELEALDEAIRKVELEAARPGDPIGRKVTHGCTRPGIVLPFCLVQGATRALLDNRVRGLSPGVVRMEIKKTHIISPCMPLLTRRRLLAGAAGIAAAGMMQPAGAVLRLEVTEGNVQPVPIAIPDFLGGSPADSELARSISQVITADLRRSGLFAPIDPAAYIEKIVNADAVPRFADWRVINAQALVTGRLTRQTDGHVRHRRDQAGRLGRAALDRGLPQRGADLGAQRPRADVLPRPRGQQRGRAVHDRSHRTQRAKDPDAEPCFGPCLVPAALVSWKLEQIERITSAKTTRSFPPNESAIFSLEFGNPRFGRRGTFGNRWAVARHAPPARRRLPEPCAIGPARKGFLKRSGDRQRGVIGQLVGVRVSIAHESLDQLQQRRPFGRASSHDPASILIGQHR